MVPMYYLDGTRKAKAPMTHNPEKVSLTQSPQKEKATPNPSLLAVPGVPNEDDCSRRAVFSLGWAAALCGSYCVVGHDVAGKSFLMLCLLDPSGRW